VKTLLVLTAVLVVFWAVTLWRAGSREAAWEAAYPPAGQFVTVDGVQVHLTVEGEGPDVVLIHGSSGNLRDMTYSLSKRLAERYRVISVDRPGLGYTDRFDPAGEPIVDQASVLARAVAKVGAERPVVLGQSYGSAVALAWGVHQTDRAAALVLVAGVSGTWDSDTTFFNRLTASWWGQRLVVPLMTAWVPTSYLDDAVDGAFTPEPTPEGYRDHFGPELSARRDSLRANGLHRVNIRDEMYELVEGYGALTMPIELVHAPEDEVVPLVTHALPFLERVPAANLVQTPGAGHMPHHLAEDEVIAAVDRAATAAGLTQD